MTRESETKLERRRIKMELRKGHFKSYYVDANNLLKGEWGGFKEDYGVGKNGEHIYGVYYSRVWKYLGVNVCHSEWIPIDEFGCFYNKFSCEKYDSVYKEREGLYICVKNGRLGLIDEAENVLLHTVYNNILTYNHLDCELACIVTTETGKFIYNVSTKRMSKVYDDVFYAPHKSEYNEEKHFFYKHNDKYGIINVNDNVILSAIYECKKSVFDTRLSYSFKDYEYSVFIKEGLLYGLIQIDKYENCFRVGDKRDGFYITELGGKFGLLSSRRKTIAEPCFDDIILYKTNDNKSGFYMIKTRDKKKGMLIVLIFVIAKKRNKYWLYNAFTGKCYLENCDNIDFRDGYYFKSNPYIEFDMNDVHGYVMSGGVTLTLNDYDDIDIDKDDIIVIKNSKKGLLNIDGYELLPCVYDDIQRKGRGYYLTIKEGVQETFDFHKPSCNNYGIYETQHYGRYSGSYAQSEMGYSDEDIDTIFDGDPSAYWNID